MAKLKNIVGQVFNRLTIVKFAYIKNKRTYWVCKCSCDGKEIIAEAYHIKIGQTKSCGCWKIENGKTVNLQHGLAHTRFYMIWAGIIQRCTKPNNPNYYKYGARGITIDPRWLDKKHGFTNFRDDMYESYLEHIAKFGENNTSIDRINNDLLINGYSKDNCKWATDSEQIRNTRVSAKTKDYDAHLYWKIYYMQTLSVYLKGNIDSDLFETLFGIRLPEFKKYIESLWFPGMNWKNKGANKKGVMHWQLDHIKEIRDFDLSKEEDRKVCFNYKNYQPLWWEANRDKALARV